MGKTTIALQLVETTSLPHHFAAADGALPSDNIWLEQQWETARLKWKQSGADSFLLVIDEIQKIENWSEAVKAQWDADTRNRLPIKILILGSSRLLLQQGLTESLAGRFEITHIPHWSYQEMKEALNKSKLDYIFYHLNRHVDLKDLSGFFIFDLSEKQPDKPFILFRKSDKKLTKNFSINDIPVLYPLSEEKSFFSFDNAYNLLFNHDLLKSAFFLLSCNTRILPLSSS